MRTLFYVLFPLVYAAIGFSIYTLLIRYAPWLVAKPWRLIRHAIMNWDADFVPFELRMVARRMNAQYWFDTPIVAEWYRRAPPINHDWAWLYVGLWPIGLLIALARSVLRKLNTEREREIALMVEEAGQAGEVERILASGELT